MRRLIVLCGFLLLTPACLSQSHVIPKHDLQALAQLPPEQRGKRVRVIQGFQSEDAPPEQQRVGGGTSVVVVAPVGPGPSHRHRRHRKAPSSAKSKSDKAYVWIVIAVAAAIALAATEGARYDGWVELHPMHPVHLWGPNGEYTWRPLAQIDPETAAWASKAMVRPSEGAFHRLERRPLSRAGWTYGVTLGYAEVPTTTGEEQGFLSHIQFGHFVNQNFGILFDVGLGWATNDNGNTLFDSRYALELQLLPVSAGKIHAGGFGQVGMGARFDDDIKGTDRRANFLGGGGIIQLELTTRLALSARAGVTQIFGRTTSDFGVGLAIY